MSIKALRNYEYAQANTQIKKIEKMVRKYKIYWLETMYSV